MADPNKVTVEFGAKVDDLAAGVRSVRAQLESLTSSVSSLGSFFRGLTGGLASAFSVAALVNYTNHMAELGQKTEDLALRLGTTNATIGLFSGLTRLTGDSVESLVTGIERVSLAVQRGTKDAFTPQAQALKILGLETKDLIGIPADKYFEKIAAAYSGLEPSLNRTNALMALGGRGIAALGPILQMGGEGYKKLAEQIRAAQNGLSAAIPAMSDTYTKLALMRISAESLGARIFVVLKPAIDLIVTSFTNWMQKLDEKTIQSFAKALVDVLGNAVITIISLFTTLGATLDEVANRIKRILMGMALGGALGIFGGPAAALGGAVIGGGVVAAWDAFVGQFKTGSENAKGEVDKQRGALVDKIKGMMDDIKAAIGNVHLPEIGGAGKGKAGAINFDARSGFDATIAQINGQIQLWQGWLTQQTTIYQRDADMFRMTEQQKLGMTMASTSQQFEATRALMQRIQGMQAGAGLVREAMETQMKILQLEQQFATERIRIQADMARDMKSKWDDVFGGLQSSFNGQLRGMLAGTTSFKQAFRTILGDMIIFFIQMIEKMVFQWIAGQLAMLTVTTATETAKTGVVAAGAVAQAGVEKASAVASIMNNMGVLFAKLSAAFAYLGPGAPAAAGAETAAIEATALGMTVGSFAVGTDYVPRTGLAMVHEGERIIPANQNNGGGMGDVHFHIHANDVRSGASYLQRNQRTIAKSLTSEVRRRNFVRPQLGQPA